MATILLAGVGSALDYASIRVVTEFEQLHPETPIEDWETWRYLPGIAALTVAGAALRRYPDARAVGSVLLVAGAASSAVTTLMGVSSYGLMNDMPLMYFVQAVGLAIEPFSLVGPLVFLPQVYPDGPIPLRRWRRVLWFSVAAVSVATACALVGEIVSAGWGGCPFENIDCPGNSVPSVMALGTTLSVIGAVSLGLAALVHRWRSGGWVVRRQIGLLSVALLLPLPAAVLVIQRGGPSDALGEVLLVVFWTLLSVGAIVISILWFGLYDIRDALQRTAAYVAITVGLVISFFLLYVIALALVVRASEGSAAPWVAAVVATVIALGVEPVRRKLQSVVDRRMFGERTRPMHVLERLSQRVRRGDEATVLDAVAITVANAVHSPAVCIGVQRGPDVEIVAGEAEGLTAGALVVAALHRGERVGEIQVAPRSRREAFSRSDLVLLQRLADQLGALLYGFRQDNEVATQRQQVLIAAGEERDRLARDLHDGLAPLLAGAGLAAEGLRRGLTSGTKDEAEAALLAERLRQAATQVRYIAHGLQSNQLAERGLGAMIMDHLDTLMIGQVPTFECHADIPRLPAPIEQEAYLLLLEAVNNVVRHAHARTCLVDLTLRNGMLGLVVADDGVGLSQPYVSGLGLTSMRTRVIALGGRFDLTSTPGQGTQMAAHVPVTAVSRDPG